MTMVLLLTLCGAVGGQSEAPERQRSEGEEAAWRLYESLALASIVSGCFSIRHQSTWSSDSLRYPNRFELTTQEFHGLGYHRVGTFETDMPELVEGGISPIWYATGLDVIEIDPDPSPIGGPNYNSVLRTTTDDGDFLLETYWFGGVSSPGDDPRRGRLVGRAYGSRVACEEAGGWSGDT